MKFVALLFGVLLFFGAMQASAQVNQYEPQSVGAGAPEVHINRDGTISIKSGRVEQMAGTTFYLSMKWGALPMRFTMKTDAKTKVTKRYGGRAEVAQIKIGDYVDAEGSFIVGSDFFGLEAATIKDWSLQEESETFSGKILEVNPDGTYSLQTPLKVIVLRAASTTSVRKGSVEIPWSKMGKGDSIVLADGVYDYVTNTLSARSVVVFQAKNPFAAKNYEGVLKHIEGTALPTALIVTVGGADYRVELSSESSVMRKNRAKAEIRRFIVGDKVRFYGPLREEPF
ncbi:MAG: hypothetical protein Q7R88_03050, partial [bacterium]|nr:hypothetical protein [bacterium]